MKTIGVHLLAAVVSLAMAVVGHGAESGGEHPFRIASYNIRLAGSVARPVDKPPNCWTCRVDRMCGLIKKHNFELMGLQEAEPQQIDDMLEVLGPKWSYVGVGREDGKRHGEHSCIFFNNERFKVTAHDTFWLSETPNVPGSKSWKTACTRVCTWADVTDLKSGKSFVFFNTHLDHISKQARLNGMRLIMQRMNELRKGRPVFFTGDMNTPPDENKMERSLLIELVNDPAREIPERFGPYSLAAAALFDAAEVSRTPHKGPRKTFNGFKFEEEPKGKPIDFIFVSEGIKVLTHMTLNDSHNRLYPSDHFPVAADVVVE